MIQFFFIKILEARGSAGGKNSIPAKTPCRRGKAGSLLILRSRRHLDFISGFQCFASPQFSSSSTFASPTVCATDFVARKKLTRRRPTRFSDFRSTLNFSSRNRDKASANFSIGETALPDFGQWRFLPPYFGQIFRLLSPEAYLKGFSVDGGNAIPTFRVKIPRENARFLKGFAPWKTLSFSEAVAPA